MGGGIISESKLFYTFCLFEFKFLSVFGKNFEFNAKGKGFEGFRNSS